MCLAAPARIMEITGRSELSIPAVVEIGGRRVPADLVMVPDAGVGDCVLMHSGYAIAILDAAEARVRLEWMGMG